MDGTNSRSVVHRKLGWPLAALILALWATIAAFTSDPTEPPRAHTDDIRLGYDLPYELLIDPEGYLDAETVRTLPSSQFETRTATLSLGYTRAASWLRLTPPATREDQAPWWLVISPPYLDDITVFVPKEGRYERMDTGDLMPASLRAVNDRHFVLPIGADPAPRPDMPMLIRLRTTSTSILSAYFTTPERFAAARTSGNFLWGLYFGVAGVTTVLCTGFGLILGSRLLLALSSFSVAYLMVASIQGFAAALLLPDMPRFAHHLTSISTLLTVASHLWVIREAQLARTRFPRADLLLQAGIALFIVGAAASVAGAYAHIAAPLLLIGSLLHALGVALAIDLARRPGVGWRQRCISLAVGASSLLAILAALTVSTVLSLPPTLLDLWQYAMLCLMLLITLISLHEFRAHRKTLAALQTERLRHAEAEQARLERRVEARTAELKRANLELERALSEERHAHLKQRQFLAMVSHEFRAPLSVIAAAAINLHEYPPSEPAELRERLAQIKRAIRRLNTLTDNCLADARLSREGPQILLAEADIAQIVASAAELVSFSQRHRLLLTVEPGADMRCICDAALVHIALSNVFDNAIKYSRRGDVTARISCTEHYVIITVRDEGPGISPADERIIFERYRRGRSAEGTAGTGMGLHVSREIMRAHGGNLRLLHSKVRDTTFEFRLPR